VIIIGAGIIGLVGGLLWKEKFGSATVDRAAAEDGNTSGPEQQKGGWSRALRVVMLCSALWFAPVIAAGLLTGPDSTLTKEGLFFSKAAVVTFGGAYAVLPYVAQQALSHYGWLRPGQMLDGLGLAETTPGPLIMVVQFVGFMGAWQNPGGMSPIAAATLGALITTWVTFVPCFLWIFLGAPHVERLRGNRKLNAALSAITAAVVGVILNLAVWFALHVFAPQPRTIDWFAVVISAAALAGMIRWKWDVIPVVAGSGVLGLIYKLVILA
jgi:chromate transporter